MPFESTPQPRVPPVRYSLPRTLQHPPPFKPSYPSLASSRALAATGGALTRTIVNANTYSGSSTAASVTKDKRMAFCSCGTRSPSIMQHGPTKQTEPRPQMTSCVSDMLSSGKTKHRGTNSCSKRRAAVMVVRVAESADTKRRRRRVIGCVRRDWRGPSLLQMRWTREEALALNKAMSSQQKFQAKHGMVLTEPSCGSRKTRR